MKNAKKNGEEIKKESTIPPKNNSWVDKILKIKREKENSPKHLKDASHGDLQND